MSDAAPPPSNLLQVTLHGKPMGKPVFADEILDALWSWVPGTTSRKAKRERCKERRRARLRLPR